MEIPKGHQAVMPYLMMKNAKGFITFASHVFCATVTMQHMREHTDLIMHGELNINGSTLMFCDATAEWTPTTANMFVYVPNADISYHAALAQGASSLMEPADKDYGRTCGITDPYGNVWWITEVKTT